MAIYSFSKEQYIPADMDTVWSFFVNPSNLSVITPPDMNFEQISEKTGQIYAGQLIRYRVVPLLGIPVKWMTEITHMDEGRFFVDEQRMGPFSFWHHQHHFEAVAGGVKMTDIIHYKNPLGWLGVLANGMLVRKRLEKIFEYRRKKTVEIWGEWTGKL
jgi:ligand-binding SRPBCC domain-containing protein